MSKQSLRGVKDKAQFPPKVMEKQLCVTDPWIRALRNSVLTFMPEVM